MLTRLYAWLVGALLGRQTWTLELFLAVQALVWGLWLMGPWSAFGQVPDVFTVLGLVPEPVWGAVFCGHGVAHLVALYRRDPHLCRRAALALSGLWAVVLVSLLLTVPLATSTPVYAANVAACAWIYTRLHWRYGDA